MDGWSRENPIREPPLLRLFPSSSEPLFYSVFRQKQGECFYYVTLVWGISFASVSQCTKHADVCCEPGNKPTVSTRVSLLVCFGTFTFPPKVFNSSDFASSCIIYCVIYSHMFCVDTPCSLFFKQTGTLCGLLSAALCFIHVKRWKVLMWKMGGGELAFSLFIGAVVV